MSPDRYVSAYRGERHRTVGAALKPRRWSRLRMAALLLVFAAGAFWAVRIAIWGLRYWRQQGG